MTTQMMCEFTMLTIPDVTGSFEVSPRERKLASESTQPRLHAHKHRFIVRIV